MNTKAIISVIAFAVFLSCCLHEAEGSLKLLKLVKAGLILKALSPKKILLPIPIPIPIGLHKTSHVDHHHDFGHHSYGHGNSYGHGHSYGHGFGHDFGHTIGHDFGHHSYGHHGPFEYKSTGYRLEAGGHWW